MSWVSNVQGLKCLGHQMSKASNVLGVKCPRLQMSWASKVRGPKCHISKHVILSSEHAPLGSYLLLGHPAQVGRSIQKDIQCSGQTQTHLQVSMGVSIYIVGFVLFYFICLVQKHSLQGLVKNLSKMVMSKYK